MPQRPEVIVAVTRGQDHPTAIGTVGFLNEVPDCVGHRCLTHAPVTVKNNVKALGIDRVPRPLEQLRPTGQKLGLVSRLVRAKRLAQLTVRMYLIH